MDQNTKIEIANAQIKYRNFSGEAGQYNPKGRRSFSVILPMKEARKLAADGWNVKRLEPKEPGVEPQPHLEVFLRFDVFPPKVLVASSKGTSLLSEEKIGMLDWADLAKVDLVIRPYIWKMPSGDSGVKAMLKSFYAVLEEDSFEAQYYNTPDSAASSIGGCGNCEVCDESCSA